MENKYERHYLDYDIKVLIAFRYSFNLKSGFNNKIKAKVYKAPF